MTTKYILPKRKADFYFSVTKNCKAPGWHQRDHWVIALDLNDGKQVILADKGKFIDNSGLHEVLRRNILTAVLELYAL